MPIPDYQSLMLPVLMASCKGEVRIGEIVNQLADQLELTPEERTELLTSGKQTIFSNRVHWAKTYLTGIATSATPDNERNYGMEDGGKRSRNILAVTPRI